MEYRGAQKTVERETKTKPKTNFAKMLQKTLDEENATDEKLTDLARSINLEANKAA